MKLLFLLSALASALHLSLAIAVNRERTNARRGMSATADCAGIVTAVRELIVCSVPPNISNDTTYRQFKKAQVYIDFMGIRNVEDLLDFGEEWPFYGLWKQGTVGDINTPKPFWFYFNDRRRWNEWKDLEGTSCDDARSRYVKDTLAFGNEFGGAGFDKYRTSIETA